MNIFLDANILVSVVNKEYPLFTYSSRLLSLVDSKEFAVYTSPVCLAIAFYFAEKKSGNKVALQKIRLLASKIKIAGITSDSVLKTIQNQKVHDVEDGFEYYSAIDAKCTCIVTEDVDDFYFSSIEVMNAQHFFEAYLVK